MFDIRVEQTLDADIEAVFESISVHARYSRFSGVSESRLLETGQDEPNGAGALRLIVTAGIRLKERIGRFERPYHMAYQIESSVPLPIKHDGGEITLKKEGSKTHVLWVSKGHVPIPFLGNRLFDPLMQKNAGAGFVKILRTIERELG